ncbi:MAG: hypothetical protein LBI14_00215 [Treponema sp.]|jgi:hypothetical protein|nr:hypothetical protein [Treponema sp.]
MPSQAAKNNIPDEPLTFEKVWATIQENDRRYQKQREENDRRYKEQQEEKNREYQKQREALEKQMKETDRRIGELGNRFGELAEHLVAPSIMEKFNELNFRFDKRAENIELHEVGDAKAYAEIDILLENRDIAIAVEVKAKPTQKDVDKHIKRIEILRCFADNHNDKRKYRGAMAGAIMTKAVREYVIKKGMYAIEQSGDTVYINVPVGFKPHEW